MKRMLKFIRGHIPGKPGWQQTLDNLRSRDIHRAARAFENMDKAATEENVPELYTLLADSDFFVRQAAAVPLARLEGARALPPLLKAIQQGFDDGHDNDGLTETIIRVVEREPREAELILRELLRSNDASMREYAAWALSFIPAI